MLRIKQQYVVQSLDGRDAPLGLSIVREDGVRLVADYSIAEAAMLVQELTAAIAAVAMAPAPLRHTVRGKTSEEGWPYGTTHDMDCPACVASGSSFGASPRSESYWSS